MNTPAIACLLLLAAPLSTASPADCVPYSAALDEMTAKLEGVLSYVQSLVPYGGPSCGGLLGAGIDEGTRFKTYYYGSGATENHLNQPTFVSDSHHCCALCQLEPGCVYWTHYYAGSNPRCELFRGESTSLSKSDFQPPVFYSHFGLRTNLDIISGKNPRGLWGDASDPLGSTIYTVLQTVEGNSERFLNPSPPVTAQPTLAAGWEFCDFIGAFRYAHFAASTGRSNGNIGGFRRVVDALECCSLCVRNVDLAGNALPGTCAFWSYDSRRDKHSCSLRGTDYAQLEDCGTSLLCHQNSLPCSAELSHPSGAACTLGFSANEWVSGFPSYAGLP